MAPSNPQQPALNHWQRRGLTIKPSDRPLVIGISIAAAVAVLFALFWIYRCVSRKPPNPLPPARPVHSQYGHNDRDKHDHNALAGSYSSLASRRSSQWKPESNTPSDGTSRLLNEKNNWGSERADQPPRLPWVNSRDSASSITTSSSSNLPSPVPPSAQESRNHSPHPASDSNHTVDLTSPKPSPKDRQDFRDGSGSPHPSFNSLPPGPRSDSRHSFYSLSPSNTRPPRGPPHKTGVQIVLPEPLAPAVSHRMALSSVSDHGHGSRRVLLKDRYSRADPWADSSRHTHSPSWPIDTPEAANNRESRSGTAHSPLAK